MEPKKISKKQNLKQDQIKKLFNDKALQEYFDVEANNEEQKNIILEAYKLNNFIKEYTGISSYIKVEDKKYIFSLLLELFSIDSEYQTINETQQKKLKQLFEEKKISQAMIKKQSREEIFRCLESYISLAKQSEKQLKQSLQQPPFNEASNMIKSTSITQLFNAEILQKIADIRKNCLDNKKTDTQQKDKQFIFNLLAKCMENDNNNQIQINILDALQHYVQIYINEAKLQSSVLDKDATFINQNAPDDAEQQKKQSLLTPKITHFNDDDSDDDPNFNSNII